jgi:erythromycin esterase
MRLVWMLLLLPTAAACQTYYNLDFEVNNSLGLFAWGRNTGLYTWQADNTVAHTGSQSLRIVNSAPSFVNSATTVISQPFSTSAAAGRRLTLTGYIKTTGVTQGYAGLWIDVQSASAGETVTNMNGTPPQGVSDWTQYQIDADVPADATSVQIGAVLRGIGTAWFDTFQTQIDGAPFPDAPPPLMTGPSALQLGWLQQHAMPIATSQPAAPGSRIGAARPTPPAPPSLSGLSPFGDVVGNAAIIGLGQGTHGTHEFFQMQIRLFQFLVEKKGATIFAMETGMPEAALVNDYIQTGKGDPVSLIEGLGEWVWKNQELVDLVVWMRHYNERHSAKLQFAGFDMQQSRLAIANVEAFVAQAEPGYLSQVQAAYALAAQAASLAQFQNAVAAADAVLKHLQTNSAQYLKTFTAAEVAWIVQNALIAEEATYARIDDTAYRETSMAANIEWILQQAPPGTNIAVFAHNLHINKTPGTMGGYLAARHGAGYVALGHLMHGGQYNALAIPPGGVAMAVTACSAVPSYPGTIEYMLHATGIPQFILDLRSASPSDPASNWITGGMFIREIGAVYAGQTSLIDGGVVYGRDGFGMTYRVARDFDALVFFDQTTPSEYLLN